MRRDPDFVFGSCDGEFPVACGAPRCRECRLSVAEAAELVHTVCDLGFGGFHGFGTGWGRAADSARSIFDCFRSLYVRDGARLWLGRARTCSRVPVAKPNREEERNAPRAPAAVRGAAVGAASQA